MFPFTLSSFPNFQSLLVLHTHVCTHTVSVLTHFQQTSTEQGQVFSLLQPIASLSVFPPMGSPSLHFHGTSSPGVTSLSPAFSHLLKPHAGWLPDGLDHHLYQGEGWRVSLTLLVLSLCPSPFLNPTAHVHSTCDSNQASLRLYAPFYPFTEHAFLLT